MRPEKKAARDAQFKKAVYEASLQIIDESGNTEFSMENVAKRAGVAKGSLYNYFSNKEELLMYIKERFLDEPRDKVEELKRSTIRSEEKMRSLVDFGFSHIAKNSKMLNFFINTMTVKNSLSAHMQFMEDFRYFIEEGIDAGEFKEHDTSISSAILAYSMKGMVDYWHFHEITEPDYEKAADNFFGLILDSIRINKAD
ncbi:TetR/AcrR family transcriptional regulator [Limisalsivibrio acetivorans]|uniref:TetR/AcrR family transcriptional regulator n=1 Tax=Limisalsivibrio acetivorans TaxID=1304888 RepID=UPI0003B6C7E6|nr:TetR/AcrR family transcriptional regulator [Limisalsivibrio acetivorans]